MCGDSTKSESVKSLLDGQLVDMIFTDPPYNVNYEGTVGKIQNDNMDNNAFFTFLTGAFENMFSGIKEGGAIYVCHADTEGVNFRTAFANAGFKLAECLIWAKDQFVFGRQDYHWRHEPILYGWKEGTGHYFINDHTQDTIWEFPRPKHNDLHPTMKPIELVGRAINNSSKVGWKVLDLFGGSGSTLIACEQANRQAFSMELDEKYVDVIVKRFCRLIGSYDNCFLIRDGEKTPVSQIPDLLIDFTSTKKVETGEQE
jgi:DNA modification methylase